MYVRQGCLYIVTLLILLIRRVHHVNAGLNEEQAGIKIAGGSSNLRYADDTTLLTESKEELKSFLMKVKEESEREESEAESSTFRKRRSWYPVPSLHGK